MSDHVGRRPTSSPLIPPLAGMLSAATGRRAAGAAAPSPSDPQVLPTDGKGTILGIGAPQQ